MAGSRGGGGTPDEGAPAYSGPFFESRFEDPQVRKRSPVRSLESLSKAAEVSWAVIDQK
ncbi:MAG: hypothetical protein KGI98_08205 [Euryarchaeota archaeon]|nr:hypothetical protein [Euryarchaeota archaeon]